MIHNKTKFLSCTNFPSSPEFQTFPNQFLNSHEHISRTFFPNFYLFLTKLFISRTDDRIFSFFGHHKQSRRTYDSRVQQHVLHDVLASRRGRAATKSKNTNDIESNNEQRQKRMNGRSETS